MNDLPVLLDHWLATDCGLTAGLDLDGNCIINAGEFAVFAENWMK